MSVLLSIKSLVTVQTKNHSNFLLFTSTATDFSTIKSREIVSCPALNFFRTLYFMVMSAQSTCDPCINNLQDLDNTHIFYFHCILV